MKEGTRKEDQMKKDETNDLSSNGWKNLPWSRCPVCNVVWYSHNLSSTFWYETWPDVNRYPVPANLPEKLCPDHTEEIVLDDDGRKKGIKRTLDQDQLSDMQKKGLACPVCGNMDLRRLIMRFDDLGPGLKEMVWECKQCHALTFLTLRFTTGDKDEVGELVSVSYREDLQTKKQLNEAWNTICRIIKSREARLKIFCE